MAYFKVTLLVIVSLVLATHAGVITTSDERMDQETYLSTLRYICLRKTGNDETFNRIQNYTEEFRNCLNKRVVQASEYTNLDYLDFSTYCTLVPIQEYCSNLMMSEMRKCLNQEVNEFIDALDSAASEAFNLMCHDRRAFFFDKDGNALKCVGNPVQLINSCAQEEFYLQPVTKLCNDMVESRNCFQSKLSQCNEPRLMELLDIQYRPIAEGGICRKYISMDENTTSINGTK